MVVLRQLLPEGKSKFVTEKNEWIVDEESAEVIGGILKELEAEIKEEYYSDDRLEHLKGEWLDFLARNIHNCDDDDGLNRFGSVLSVLIRVSEDAIYSSSGKMPTYDSAELSPELGDLYSRICSFVSLESESDDMDFVDAESIKNEYRDLEVISDIYPYTRLKMINIPTWWGRDGDECKVFLDGEEVCTGTIADGELMVSFDGAESGMRNLKFINNEICCADYDFEIKWMDDELKYNDKCLRYVAKKTPVTINGKEMMKAHYLEFNRYNDGSFKSEGGKKLYLEYRDILTIIDKAKEGLSPEVIRNILLFYHNDLVTPSTIRTLINHYNNGRLSNAIQYIFQQDWESIKNRDVTDYLHYITGDLKA